MNEAELETQLSLLDAAQVNCNNCGLCLASCPSYQETYLEEKSPRGRIQLARDLRDGKMMPKSHLLDPLGDCQDCTACESSCPYAVPIRQIVDVAEGIRQDFQKPKKGLWSRFRRWLKS